MTDIKETIQGLYALKTYLASKAIEEHGPARESLIGMQKVVDSAVNLLKEQEARVMALDELTEIYVEFKGNNCPVRLTNFDLQKIVKHAVDGDCRLWTGKPTDEQRQAVKWNE